MQKNIRLAIPNPCHEKWNDFEKTAQGGFCGSCQKEVIDFTHWSEEQLKTYFRKPAFNTCGRFRQEQLKVYTFAPSPSKRNWLSFAVVSILLLLSSRQTSANTVSKIRQHVEQLLPGATMGEPVASQSDSTIVVKGKVRYAGDRSTLPGVNVMCKGKDAKTVTDGDGNFTLTLKNPSPSDILVFEFIGLQTVEHPIHKNDISDMQMVMSDDLTIVLGGGMGTVVAGGVQVVPWYSPRRWWWDVKRCFRN